MIVTEPLPNTTATIRLTVSSFLSYALPSLTPRARYAVALAALPWHDRARLRLRYSARYAAGLWRMR